MEERDYTHSTKCDKVRTTENHHRTGNSDLFYLIDYLFNIGIRRKIVAEEHILGGGTKHEFKDLYYF